MIYKNENNFIQQITTTDCHDLPHIPKSDDVTAVHLDFYNGEICGCYYEPTAGKFFENEEMTMEITEPEKYMKPAKEIVSEYPYGLTVEQLEDVEQQAVNKITEEASKE